MKKAISAIICAAMLLTVVLTVNVSAENIINDGITYVREKDHLILSKCDASVSGGVVIPEYIEDNGEKLPVTSIGEEAFNLCTGIVSLSIPDTVTSLGEWMCYECKNLKSVSFGFGITEIAMCAFTLCDSLESVAVPEGVTVINDGAFDDCDALASVILPDGLKEIKAFAFRNCLALKEIIIPDTVTEIGEGAFAYDKKLQTVLIPAGVGKIGKNILQNCDDLTKVYYLGSEEDWKKVDVDESNKKLTDHIVFHTEHTYDNDTDAICNVCGHERSFTVTFSDHGGVVSAAEYKLNKTVNAPKISGYSDETYNYTFKEWDKEVTVCKGKAEYTALYDKEYIDYTVKFLDCDQSVLSEEKYHYGDKVKAPEDPTKKEDKVYTYKFTGWDKDVTDCKGSASYTAVFESEYVEYTVKFVNDDGSVLSEERYHYGDKVKAPEDPAHKYDKLYKFTFTGWDKKIEDCTGDAVYTALYDRTEKYTIKDLNGDGSIDNKDLVTLFDNISSGKKADCEYIYDVDRDGEVNNKDVVVLFRFLSQL